MTLIITELLLFLAIFGMYSLTVAISLCTNRCLLLVLIQRRRRNHDNSLPTTRRGQNQGLHLNQTVFDLAGGEEVRIWVEGPYTVHITCEDGSDDEIFVIRRCKSTLQGGKSGDGQCGCVCIPEN